MANCKRRNRRTWKLWSCDQMTLSRKTICRSWGICSTRDFVVKTLRRAVFSVSKDLQEQKTQFAFYHLLAIIISVWFSLEQLLYGRPSWYLLWWWCKHMIPCSQDQWFSLHVKEAFVCCRNGCLFNTLASVFVEQSDKEVDIRLSHRNYLRFK